MAWFPTKAHTYSHNIYIYIPWNSHGSRWHGPLDYLFFSTKRWFSPSLQLQLVGPRERSLPASFSSSSLASQVLSAVLSTWGKSPSEPRLTSAGCPQNPGVFTAFHLKGLFLKVRGCAYIYICVYRKYSKLTSLGNSTSSKES